jgi:hypothetical protein
MMKLRSIWHVLRMLMFNSIRGANTIKRRNMGEKLRESSDNIAQSSTGRACSVDRDGRKYMTPELNSSRVMKVATSCTHFSLQARAATAQHARFIRLQGQRSVRKRTCTALLFTLLYALQSVRDMAAMPCSTTAGRFKLACTGVRERESVRGAKGKAGRCGSSWLNVTKA